MRDGAPVSIAGVADRVRANRQLDSVPTPPPAARHPAGRTRCAVSMVAWIPKGSCPAERFRGPGIVPDPRNTDAPRTGGRVRTGDA